MGLIIAGFCVGILVAVGLYVRHICALEKRINGECGLPEVTDCPPMPKCKPYDQPDSKKRYRWVTAQDKLVCSNCSVLHGKIFTHEEMLEAGSQIYLLHDKCISKFSECSECRCIFEVVDRFCVKEPKL